MDLFVFRPRLFKAFELVSITEEFQSTSNGCP